MCSYLKGPGIGDIVGYNGPVIAAPGIVLQRVYIYTCTHSPPQSVVFSRWHCSSRLLVVRERFEALGSTVRKKPLAARRFVSDRGKIVDHINRNSEVREPHRKRLLTSEWLERDLEVTCCKLHSFEWILICFNYGAPVVVRNFTSSVGDNWLESAGFEGTRRIQCKIPWIYDYSHFTIIWNIGLIWFTNTMVGEKLLFLCVVVLDLGYYGLGYSTYPRRYNRDSVWGTCPEHCRCMTLNSRGTRGLLDTWGEEQVSEKTLKYFSEGINDEAARNGRSMVCQGLRTLPDPIPAGKRGPRRGGGGPTPIDHYPATE